MLVSQISVRKTTLKFEQFQKVVWIDMHQVSVMTV